MFVLGEKVTVINFFNSAQHLSDKFQKKFIKSLRKMKSWIVVTIVVLIVGIFSNNALEIPEHLKKQAKKLHQRCQNQTDTPDDVIRSSAKGILPKNKNFECYIQCLFDIMGIMGENNLIHIEYLQQILPEDTHTTLTTLSQACGTKEGSDKCNIAFNTMVCYVQEIPTLITDNLEFLFD